jgi:hypothetical protein
MHAPPRSRIQHPEPARLAVENFIPSVPPTMEVLQQRKIPYADETQGIQFTTLF